jgi:2-dehydro-3-deoxyphosphogluconate aldolase/(4S)-4-hydroxy-2-oxoglutarate aldolase
MNMRDVFALGPVMPVIVIDRLTDAVPLARALVAGGVRALEVTLRTPVALEAIRAIAAEVPDAVVGAGTLVIPSDFDRVRAAGARFAISPGAGPDLLRAGRDSGIPFAPGTMTPSDVIQAMELGFDAVKLFPAMQAGGIGMLKAMHGPFPDLLFCPTGGVSADTAPQFLALPNVGCVGGSWLAPAARVAAGDWAGITALASAAAALRA